MVLGRKNGSGWNDFEQLLPSIYSGENAETCILYVMTIEAALEV